MSRLAHFVAPGLPHHVTQRGNGRQMVFFEDSDYLLYKDLVFDAASRAGCEIWCWCLMPNRSHMIIVPSDTHGLRLTFADAHLVRQARDWRWSSVRDHLNAAADRSFKAGAVLGHFGDFKSYLGAEDDEAVHARLRGAETIGRPLGSTAA